MDIKVEIKTKNHYDNQEEPLIQKSVVDVEGVIVLDSELDTIIDHVYSCLVGLGFSGKFVNKYIDRDGMIENKK